ncbi:MAG: sulfatase-like hydrolase/transferase, partial [Candidatus Aminicenantes bacterium]|nr:sulfatase-like hydrolase/transferase [Candidatus Aminicenantes bacterium]
IASEAAVDFIDRNQDRNFFLFVHTYQIHNPYQSPPPYNEMFLEEDAELKKADMKQLRFYHENRYMPVSEKVRDNFIGLYDGGIRYTDEALIKPILAKLKTLGLYDKTMIVLTSDHGEEFYEHKSWVHKHSLYNETIRIPLIIKSFESEYAGEKTNEIVSLVDVMPTILDALNIDYSNRYLDGKSLYSLLSEKKEDREDRIFISDLDQAFPEHIPKKIAINQGKFKLIVNENYLPEDIAFFHYPPPKFQKLEVYDLAHDPGELVNLAPKNPELARRLLSLLTGIYRQKTDVTTKKAEMDESLQEQLKALGYIK